jgi:4-alpha-glucanotransferase
MLASRSSGILLHPTSLPSPGGSGDLGEAARAFVDFLAAAGQAYWQVLPLTPPGYGESPYQAFSAFSGNPLLLNLEHLVQGGYLERAALDGAPALPEDSVDFGAAAAYKVPRLEQAGARFRSSGAAPARAAFERFCAEQAHWLDDYALYMALRAAHAFRPWYEWDAELAARAPQALACARATLADAIDQQRFQQWQFYEQWTALKGYANARGIGIIGDIPIFVSLDSADVWAERGLFHFDAQLRPTVVSGVPPDYFSATGQLWGHPLYRWDAMAGDGYAWWVARFRHALTLADVVRVDHFRGFHNYWEVPSGESTAINGRWRAGSGPELFRKLRAALGELAVIAEDLGEFDVAARAGLDALQTEFGFPGMRVLQFAFGGGADNTFLPHHFQRECVVYTGTHDNDTLVGWYQAATDWEREHVRRYTSSGGADIAWDMIRLAWASVANTAMTTAQDLLGLGHSARMNTPGTAGPPNWGWRLRPGMLTGDIAARLRGLTELYGRLTLSA